MFNVTFQKSNTSFWGWRGLYIKGEQGYLDLTQWFWKPQGEHLDIWSSCVHMAVRPNNKG